MNKVLSILFTISTLLALTACEREDDIDVIFIGKTWYMNGGKFNGKGMDVDVKNFYTEEQNNAYFITFYSDRFQGRFSSGVPFSGKWTVDGKKHNISLTFDSRPSVSTNFDLQLYDVMKATKSYESGGNFLLLKQDNDNMVMFGTSRTITN